MVFAGLLGSVIVLFLSFVSLSLLVTLNVSFKSSGSLRGESSDRPEEGVVISYKNKVYITYVWRKYTT